MCPPLLYLYLQLISFTTNTVFFLYTFTCINYYRHNLCLPFSFLNNFKLLKKRRKKKTKVVTVVNFVHRMRVVRIVTIVTLFSCLHDSLSIHFSICIHYQSYFSLFVWRHAFSYHVWPVLPVRHSGFLHIFASLSCNSKKPAKLKILIYWTIWAYWTGHFQVTLIKRILLKLLK